MARRKLEPHEEPHIGVRFGEDGDPDCFAGPFFTVELMGDELHGYRTDPCDRTPPEIIARRMVLGDGAGPRGWAAVYNGKTNESDWFDNIRIVMVCGKTTKHGPCQNPYRSEDCDETHKK